MNEEFVRAAVETYETLLREQLLRQEKMERQASA